MVWGTERANHANGDAGRPTPADAWARIASPNADQPERNGALLGNEPRARDRTAAERRSYGNVPTNGRPSASDTSRAE